MINHASPRAVSSMPSFALNDLDLERISTAIEAELATRTRNLSACAGASVNRGASSEARRGPESLVSDRDSAQSSGAASAMMPTCVSA